MAKTIKWNQATKLMFSISMKNKNKSGRPTITGKDNKIYTKIKLKRNFLVESKKWNSRYVLILSETIKSLVCNMNQPRNQELTLHSIGNSLIEESTPDRKRYRKIELTILTKSIKRSKEFCNASTKTKK